MQQSIATKITNGVTIKLIIIDNIMDQLAVNETYTIKNNGTIARNNNSTITFEAPITDGEKVKADQETLGILNIIEKRIAKNENMGDNKIIKKMVPMTETTIEEIPNAIEEITEEESEVTVNKKPIRKRNNSNKKKSNNSTTATKPKGRPRRKLPQSDVTEVLMQD